MKIGKLPLKNPRTIWNIDGTHNKARHIKNFMDLQIRCGNQKKQMRFLVTELGGDEIVLGYPWLAAFQPKIDWKNATIEECMQPLVIKTLGLNLEDEVTKIRKAWVSKAEEMAKPGEQIFIHQIDQEEIRR